MVMQIMDEVAARHGLACLSHEKPFSGVNGSGKHNNISLGAPPPPHAAHAAPYDAPRGRRLPSFPRPCRRCASAPVEAL